MPTIAYDATLVALTTPGERDALLGLPGFTLSEFDALCAESARLAYVGFDRTPRERQRLDDALARAGVAASTRRRSEQRCQAGTSSSRSAAPNRTNSRT